MKGKEQFEIHYICSNYVNDTFTQDPEQDVKIRRTAYNRGIDRDRVLDVFIVELRGSLIAIERA